MTRPRGLNVGVVGLGAMGRHHARILSTLSGVRLTAISDVDLDKAYVLGDKYSNLFFDDYQKIASVVDAVSIVTPTSTHLEIGSFFLNSGKHVLIEKPLAGDSEDAKKLVDLAKFKNLILAVGHIERFNPAFQELRKLIRKEKIIGLTAQRFSPFPERITDANVLQDMMIHDLDLLTNLLPKEEIESIKAEGKKIKTKNLDKVSTTIFFENGVVAKIEADRVFGIKMRKITVTTERGLYEADLLNKQVYVRDLVTHVPSAHATKKVDQLTAELHDFIKAIKNNSAPKVSGEDGFKAIQLVEEVEKACS
jgi:predicted dehydrogenase